MIALILLLSTTLPGKSEKLCCLHETKLSSTSEEELKPNNSVEDHEYAVLGSVEQVSRELA